MKSYYTFEYEKNNNIVNVYRGAHFFHSMETSEELSDDAVLKLCKDFAYSRPDYSDNYVVQVKLR